jgi:hypothetical protein
MAITVKSQITAADLTPGSNPSVSIVAVQDLQDNPGCVDLSTGARLVGTVRPVVDGSGNWSVALTPQILIAPSGSMYKAIVVVGGVTTVTYFQVPSSGGPYWMADLAVVQPTMIGPGGSSVSTRFIWIPAEDMTADGGATLVTVGTMPDAVKAWALRHGNTDGVSFSAVVPAEISTGVATNYVPFWIPSASSSGNVRWSLDAKSLLGGSDVTAVGAISPRTFIGGALTANVIANDANSSIGLGTALIPGVGLRFNLRRLGSDAADTYAGDAQIWGIRLTFPTVY